jgi:hypothetical protein
MKMHTSQAIAEHIWADIVSHDSFSAALASQGMQLDGVELTLEQRAQLMVNSRLLHGEIIARWANIIYDIHKAMEQES